MKKILSALLVAAMLVTTLVVATVSVSAVDGDWSVYAIKSQYLDDYAGYMSDIPGYKYTDEGLKMIPAPWKDSNPYATFQTTDKVNLLNDGVYLKVRVDQFTYTASDTWFGFSLWDDQNVQLGQQGGEYGVSDIRASPTKPMSALTSSPRSRCPTGRGCVRSHPSTGLSPMASTATESPCVVSWPRLALHTHSPTSGSR